MKNPAKYVLGLSLGWLVGFAVSGFVYSFARAAAKVVALVMP